MHKSIFALSLFVLFSLSIASNSSKNENYHENYKNQTLKEKINQMRVLGLDEASSSKQSNAQPIKKGLMIKSQIDVASKAEFIGKEPMIPSSGRDECEEGYVDDCSGDGDCCPESWISDGVTDCEDQLYGCDLTCYDNDGGDCAGEGDGGGDDGNADDGGTGGDDGGSDCVDCVGNDCSGYEQWIGDGICDDGEYGIFYNCIEFECDAGDCGFDSNGECENNWEDDGGTGGDDGGAGSCDEVGGNETWLGDGWCDTTNNNEACGYDSGDCCYSTCASAAYDCEADTGPCAADICIDPDGNNDDCEDSNNDDGGEGECSGYSEEDCMWFDYCMWTDAGCVDYDGSECQNYDCMDQCYDGYEDWIGDGWCDDGSWGVYFNCDEFDCDYGDCLNEAGECAGNTGDDGGDDGGEYSCSDLGYEDCMYVDDCEWNPGWDDGAGGFCVDAGWSDDGGNEGCSEGYIEDCADDDCCPESWIGDGFADCEDQPWGCDLTCYENDGGDCGETGDDGGEYSCSDLGYEDCMYVDDCEWISNSDDPASGGICVDAGTGDDGGNEGCDDGYVEDCSDDDCCPEGWIGDGFADCEDQSYGCDLSCYDNDGGDCEDNGDDGGWETQAAVILGDGFSTPGGDVHIPLFLESTVSVSGIQFTMNASPSDWQTVIDLSAMVSTADCFEADFNNTENGTIGLIYSLSGCEFNPSDESAQIGTMTLEISEQAEWGGVIELYFTELIVASSGGEQVNAEGYGGLITIGAVGDVNHDGEINVIDAVAMIQFILQFEEPGESEFWASDINQDGSLDILDVVVLIEMILDN